MKSIKLFMKRLFNKIKLPLKWASQIKWRWIFAILLTEYLFAFILRGVVGHVYWPATVLCQGGCNLYWEITRWMVIIPLLFALLSILLKLIVWLARNVRKK